MKTTLIIATTLFFSFYAWAVKADQKGLEAAVLQKIHFINQAEIKIAKLGETKACRFNVKNFAYQIENDHAKTDALLLGFAKFQDLNLPAFAFPNPWEAGNFAKVMSAEAELRLTNSCDFDQKFLLDLKSGHLFAIELTEKALTHLDQTDGTAIFLRKHVLPGLRMHYQMAMKLLSEVE